MGVVEPGEDRDARQLAVVVEVDRDPDGEPNRGQRIHVPTGGDAVAVALAALLDPSIPRSKIAPALAIRTGDPRSDELLDSLAPLLAELLAGLTERQRTVARLLLVERLRQADVAQRLGIRRATVSVMAGRLRSIERLVRTLRVVVADASASATHRV